MHRENVIVPIKNMIKKDHKKTQNCRHPVRTELDNMIDGVECLTSEKR